MRQLTGRLEYWQNGCKKNQSMWVPWGQTWKWRTSPKIKSQVNYPTNIPWRDRVSTELTVKSLLGMTTSSLLHVECNSWSTCILEAYNFDAVQVQFWCWSKDSYLWAGTLPLLGAADPSCRRQCPSWVPALRTPSRSEDGLHQLWSALPCSEIRRYS